MSFEGHCEHFESNFENFKARFDDLDDNSDDFASHYEDFDDHLSDLALLYSTVYGVPRFTTANILANSLLRTLFTILIPFFPSALRLSKYAFNSGL